MTGNWQSAIDRARADAPFLSLALDRMPDLTGRLAEGDGAAALERARQAGAGATDVDQALRRERLALALTLAIGDLAGDFPLTTVVNELSAFADRALDTAITEAIRRRVPDAAPTGFLALALGKHGAQELNYSSDIDPILLYDPRTLPRRERDDPGEAAQRYARTIVELLSRQTGDGYVFRVDLRLRPASEVSPLAISVDAALTHYESSALAWERAAFIRARACSGEIPAGEAFLAAIRPFIWRRSLDFMAIEEIRRLTTRIRDTFSGPLEPGPGFCVKRGRGGIREIEFFAQTHQLIYGGRMPSLRLRGTRAALDALAGEGIISTDAARELGTAYDRLRTVEHRIQMVEDRQTHKLPDNPAAIDGIARLDGLPDGATLIEEVRGICRLVGNHYDSLLDNQDGGSTSRSPAPSRFAERAQQWSDNLRALRSTEARSAFNAILPDLLDALERAPDPDGAATRWESLLTRLPTAVNLFRLFEQRPGLLQLVLQILTLAPPLAEEMARRPDLLDALIDSTAFDLPADVAALKARMQRREAGDDYEQRLSQIRHEVGEERFALGVQLIDSRQDPLDIAAGLSRVAEAALASAAEAATAEFETNHGKVPGGDLVVLGLGRLGGGALTHASDLDLIYLFTGDIGVESDGRRPLTASLYFNRLAQRVTAALSVATAEGALYEVDTRLRPQGNQGPLAVNLAGFARYQRDDAWTWEHMALARARPLFGPDAAQAALRQTIREVLASPRDPVQLKADILKMRGDMAEHKRPAGPLDAKLLRGGLVDCEFIVHFLQLRDRTGFDPNLEAAIEQLVAEGLLTESFSAHHSLLSRLLVAARLLAPDCKPPSNAACAALAGACGVEDFDALLQALGQARHGVAATWADLFGQQLEIDA
ncbi:glutamine-synthetase adenylyltransferase [Altererythrobacter xixiisoli]|uniref:Glutamine-synthetase adenylyltransferase n=1 Tax=Croceibacterium xixiisoli TaxID=1476466 RepID=A0A6I4TR68_9SPHN|nr:glutamine-synthetase adenylyltransferase [Croceibacterium xixiisoli]MXO97620.1 glutamine-synthetase adenylyltransferase [Croceibacterium xixiisoli]